MKYNLREFQDKVTIVDLEGEIDTVNNEKFERLFDGLLNSKRPKIILNFKKVTYINSTGLGIIAASLKRLRETRGELKIVNVSTEILEIFEMIRFTKIIGIYDNEELALEAVGI